MDETKLLFKPGEVGDALGVCRSKAYALISRGIIPSIRIDGSVRVPVAALKAWIAERTREQVDAVSAPPLSVVTDAPAARKPTTKTGRRDGR
jgi:excisionase family DNA binding protein